MSRVLNSSQVDDAIRLYTSGESEKKVAEKFGVSRNVIRRCLEKASAHIRGRSEAELLKWGRMKGNRLAVERQCSGAWKASKGRKNSTAHQNKIALAVFKRQLRKFTHEDQVAAMVEASGFPVVQQFPVGPYNLDIALDGSPVAVEVIGATPWEFVKTKGRERLEYLLNRGWCVVLVRWKRASGTAARMNLSYVAEELIPFLQRTRRDKSVFGKYRVILGDPEYVPLRGYNLDGLPIVE